MATDGQLFASGTLGIDNRSPRNRLPEGTVRDLVNLDPGQTLRLRAGFQLQHAASTNIHGCLGYQNGLLLADGEELVYFDLNTNAATVVGSCPARGGLTGDELNGLLYFCTADRALVFDRERVSPWGVQRPASQPGVIPTAGGSIRGTVQIAVTYKDASGKESGSPPSRSVVGNGDAFVIAGLDPPEGGSSCIYVSQTGSVTMYLAGETTGSSFTVTGPGDPRQRPLQNQGDRPPPVGHIVRAFKGGLLIAQGSTVWRTQPLRPHTVDPQRGFFPYSQRVTAIAPVENAVFVSADRTYRLASLDVEPTQDVVYSGQIVEGSVVTSSDRSARWLTEDGYVRASPDGAITKVAQDRFAPLHAEFAPSGEVQYDGRSMMVSTLKGRPRNNALASTDFIQAEVIRHAP